jgi:hypothetical protein
VSLGFEVSKNSCQALPLPLCLCLSIDPFWKDKDVCLVRESSHWGWALRFQKPVLRPGTHPHTHTHTLSLSLSLSLSLPPDQEVALNYFSSTMPATTLPVLMIVD